MNLRLRRVARQAELWFQIASAVLVLVTCLAWARLLVGTDRAAPAAISTPAAGDDGLREPIGPLPPPPVADPAKLALGEALFSDPRVFGAGQVSCASCHDVGSNGATPNRFDLAATVNTPTVFNAVLNFRLNWKGDLDTLERQARSALRAHGSAANDPAQAVARLNQSADTRRRFQLAYGHDADEASLLDAIATYERSLVTPASRFDRWLDGDKAALTADEVEGYRTFKTLGCIACHQGVNVGGNLYEHSGVFHPLTGSGPILLRVPSLRNVAATAPYFHDGSAPTLADAVRRMASAQLNRQLSEQQTRSLVDFLETLTGAHDGAPVRAPAP